MYGSVGCCSTLLGLACLDHPSFVQNEDLVGDDPRTEQVVRDVEQAQTALGAQFGQ